MDKDFFMNTGIPPPLGSDTPLTWQAVSTSMEMQSTQTPDCFLSPPPMSENFESALSSMVASPATASNAAISNENFMIRELIGKLGNICNSNDIPPGAAPSLAPYYGGGSGGNYSANNSCYSTPLSSPPKIGMPIMDQLVKENFPTLGNSFSLSFNLPAMPGDTGFAERAARFSSFGSRSFNGRTSQFGLNNNNNNGHKSNALDGNGKLQRVSSSPSLKAVENSVNERKLAGNSSADQPDLSNSRENSSISGGENGSSRKRKAPPKGKAKETPSSMLNNPNKVGENGDDSNAKRSKTEEVICKEDTKTEENRGGDECQKQSNAIQKPPEPPKDYIHVRARRGQATDSHSLAERVRREKISERMKLLQDLVPGCNKVTGKALMLDEIITYVQSLQGQVEFLSMKLASVNPRLDFNMDNLISKDVIQPNCSLPHPMYPIDTLAPTLYGQPHQNSLQNSIPTGGSMAPYPTDPLHPTLHQNHGLQLPSINGFTNGVFQLPTLTEGDLQSIVQMGFGQKENGFQSQSLHGQIKRH